MNLTDARFEILQSLWSNYGSIKRYFLPAQSPDSVIVKQVQLPDEISHPRGWNTNRSHQRKLRSYQVESLWYRSFAQRCDDSCRVPRCYQLEQTDSEFLMVLEDLDAAGFALRHESLSPQQMIPCLHWLANFHATFMGCSPATDQGSLWPVGSYWHLATRPDELAALEDQPLKNAAAAIDQKLSSARYQTLVHGDAKLANFCFSEDGQQVAAVDFQYVGGGCGMKDVAYFIGSCLYEADCERHEALLLDAYFAELRAALNHRQPAINADALEQEWRELFPYAWADFHRFLKGWSPGHWKINAYSERLSQRVIAELTQ